MNLMNCSHQVASMGCIDIFSEDTHNILQPVVYAKLNYESYSHHLATSSLFCGLRTQLYLNDKLESRGGQKPINNAGKYNTYFTDVTLRT